MAMPTDVIPTGPESREVADPAQTVYDSAPRMHRVRTVRLQQGTSLRSVARQTGVDVRQLRIQEQESTDIRLSDLHKWQKALGVPLSELLEEPESELSRPVMERARLVRLMKTAAAIRERAGSPAIERMAHMLIEQLTEIMPELSSVNPWHEFGQRRGLNEYGRIVDRTIADDLMHTHAYDD
jgi:transcriptional regulator with XRE-family HTH domain